MLTNLTIYRLPAPWAMSANALMTAIESQRFAACTSIQMASQGWVPVRSGTDELVYKADRQYLLCLRDEKKLLPSSVINEVAKERAVELEEQQGFAPGRKQMKELKEAVTDELLPRAFSIKKETLVWIDPVKGWLVVDTGTGAKADDVLKLLLKAIPKFPVESLRTQVSPQSAMTSWLASDEAPHGFTVDQEAELCASGDSKATVRFLRHTLDVADVRRHIESGKQCTRLALTWNDRMSFVLTDKGIIKKVTPLDVLKEDTSGTSQNDEERFKADALMMTGELTKMMADVVEALGGIQREEVAEAA